MLAGDDSFLAIDLISIVAADMKRAVDGAEDFFRRQGDEDILDDQAPVKEPVFGESGSGGGEGMSEGGA